MALTAKQKEAVAAASQQPTLGAQLLAGGIQSYNSNPDAKAVVKQLWFNWYDDHSNVSQDTYLCVQGGLDGLKDDTLAPDWWEGPTIQSSTKCSIDLEDALDNVGKFDKGAADLLADAIHGAQDGASQYASTLLGNFAKHAWRGAKQAIELIGGAAGAAAKGLAIGLGWQGFLLVGAVVGIYALARSGGPRVSHENPRRFLGPLR